MVTQQVCLPWTFSLARLRTRRTPSFLLPLQQRYCPLPLPSLHHSLTVSQATSLAANCIILPPSLSLSSVEGKGEIKSEIKSPPPSIRPPWSRPEAAPQPATPSEQKPIPSVHTPREPGWSMIFIVHTLCQWLHYFTFCSTVPSVKARMGAENPPDSVPPSLPPSVPPSSRPTTPSKMDTGSIPTPSKYKVEADPSLRKGTL